MEHDVTHDVTRDSHAVTHHQRGRVTFRTTFGSMGPPCLVCGRRLWPFKPRHCKPHKPK